MARRPDNFHWIGLTKEQEELLGTLDFVGNNAWARTGQTDAMMPRLLGRLAEAGLSIDETVEAMRAVGYEKHALHQLRRWESKRTTGKFGR